MITKGGQVKLIDFDVAFKMDKKTKIIEVLGGSPGKQCCASLCGHT